MAVAISEGFKTCPEALLLRNIEKTQKRCKKVLTEGWGCGIILERQGPPERMTSESGRGHCLRNGGEICMSAKEKQGFPFIS